MYAYQIRNFLDKKSEDINVYVTPVNMLPRRVSYPLALVINLSESMEPGIYWVAVYINEKREGFYFDSYGFKPRDVRIETFLKIHCSSWHYNTQQVQQVNSKVCGYYCVVFLFYMINKINVKSFMNQFTKNLVINDYIINQVFNTLNV